MSLDVTITSKCTCGHGDDWHYEFNVTHNLNKMAKAAGIYEAMWRPDEKGYKTVADIIPILREGYNKMIKDPDHYKQFDAPNGWGVYEDFITIVRKYLEACESHPNAKFSYLSR